MWNLLAEHLVLNLQTSVSITPTYQNTELYSSAFTPNELIPWKSFSCSINSSFMETEGSLRRSQKPATGPTLTVSYTKRNLSEKQTVAWLVKNVSTVIDLEFFLLLCSQDFATGPELKVNEYCSHSCKCRIRNKFPPNVRKD
jgi:hypothetical protein